MREKKPAWDGSKLAQGQLGQLLDYARELKFNDPIDYAHYRAQLRRLSEDSADDICSISESSIILFPCLPDVLLHSDLKPTKFSNDAQPSVPGKCPVEVGQLVCVRINARISIEGYSLQALDPWHDPALYSEEWCTVARPAIVLDVKFDTVLSLYKIQLVSMGQGTLAKSGKPARKVSGPLSVQNESIVLNLTWPMPDTYFYAFPRAPWFYCLPYQVWLSFPTSS